jgi:squalene-hopene/tetraprenyl-beta-curcumene cyclase
LITAGKQFLQSQQNSDGSWGGHNGIPGTIEETSLAICALTQYNREACIKGFEWLDDRTQSYPLPSSPIGLYFAALWYDEKMYPLVFYVEALRRFLQSDLKS